jgi:hypothetical protein
VSAVEVNLRFVLEEVLQRRGVVSTNISLVFLLCSVKGKGKDKAVYRPGHALRAPGT